ncbi:sulfatase family protein [Breznakiella homolactica]|uniref:Sulfatase-like hydrolase/transferase n=1 Tax=Breznakiella homolactica TaxID=2798577 RepID=A0A7T7XKY1_9SPIR|nr:sulfatase-like hydrolase/transferase [Breznakiella homolactica]QQO08107.1 sulfatase-like hydrolase/transferase [Breznakiella homolactica]
MAERSNILFIMTDEQKFSAVSGLSGISDLTPNFDRLAKEGVCFTNAYTPSPVCGPARAAIMSGMFPPSCGVAKNWSPFSGEVSLMTERLKTCGYETAAIGKLHFVPSQDDFGFEYKRLHDAPYSIYANDDKESAYIQWLQKGPFAGRFDPVKRFDEDELAFNTDIRKFMMGSAFRTEEEHDVAWTGREGVEFLQNRGRDRPFFLFLSFFGPHMPYDPPAPYGSMYDWRSIKLPDSYYKDYLADSPIFKRLCSPLRERILSELTEDDCRQIIAAYLGQVKMVDDYVGRVIRQLEESGEYDNTTIIFTSDHGDHMGSYGLFFKGQMYDSCCKVPLVIKPADGKAGVREPSVVSTIDLYGTILDLAGDATWRRPGIEARTLQPMLRNDTFLWDDVTFSIIGGNRDEALSMVRRGPYKLGRLADGGPQKALYELFDLEADPDESHDVFEDPAYSKIRAMLVSELDAWFRYQYAHYPDQVTSVRSEDHSFNGVKNL